MVKHIVTFRMKGSADERLAAAQDFATRLRALPAIIDVLDSIEVGINENPSEDWDLVLTATVPTMADVAIYANHPAHVAAAGSAKPHIASRACVDYTV